MAVCGTTRPPNFPTMKFITFHRDLWSKLILKPIGRHVLTNDGGALARNEPWFFVNAVWVNVFITAGGRLGPDSLCSHTDKDGQIRTNTDKER